MRVDVDTTDLTRGSAPPHRLSPAEPWQFRPRSAHGGGGMDEEAALLAQLEGLGDEPGPDGEEQALLAQLQRLGPAADEGAALLAQLEGLGDEAAALERALAGGGGGGQAAGPSRSGLEAQVREAKRQAVQLKRAGQLDEARAVLRRAKALQQELESRGPEGAAAGTGPAEAPVSYEQASDSALRAMLEARDLIQASVDAESAAEIGETEDPQLLEELKKLVQSEGAQEDGLEAAAKSPAAAIANLRAQVLETKRKAIECKRAGDMAKARELLRVAKEVQAQVAVLERAQAPAAGDPGPSGPGPDPENDEEEEGASPEVLEQLRVLMAETGGEDGAGGEGEGPAAAPEAESRETLRQQAKQLKVAAVRKKRAGDLQGAREALRAAKDLEARAAAL